MQDIAGCRIVVSDVLEQDRVVARIQSTFGRVSTFDRRERASFGYRAVHLVVIQDDRPVEVQVRTELQHLWAELSEKLADMLDHRIKYGGGSEVVQQILFKSSDNIRKIEVVERRLAATAVGIAEGATPLSNREELNEVLRDVAVLKQQMRETFQKAHAAIQELSRDPNAIPD